MAQYKKHLTVFFDILGFADLVNKTEDANKIYEILSTVNFVSSNLKKQLKRSTFSDLVVLATDQTTSYIGNEAYTILDNVFDEIARVQTQLIQFKILVRGGITFDDLYIDENFVFGRGLNYAYSLESKTANYPRIIIDPLVFDAYSSGYENHQQIISMDTDGAYYVDFFKYITAKHRDYLSHSTDTFLRDYKEFIESSVMNIKSTGLTSINLKYAWLINKHNECLSKLPELYGEETKKRLNEYKIDANLIKILTTRNNDSK